MAPRRITPQLISTAQAAPAQAAFAAASAQPSAAPASTQGSMSQKQHSEYAAKHLGPGRRVYVALGPDANVVNWRKVQLRSSTVSMSCSLGYVHCAQHEHDCMNHVHCMLLCWVATSVKSARTCCWRILRIC